MRALAAIAVVAAIGAFTATPAEAGRRIQCLCDGKDKSWVHHTFACEHHFKRPFAKGAGMAKPVRPCTAQEWAQFRTYLCVSDRCTYAWVRSSVNKVPLTEE